MHWLCQIMHWLCQIMHWLCQFRSVQSLSHVQLSNTMDCSMPGFPVHHQLLQLAQTPVHWVSDAIQPSHPLSSASPPTFNLSQHQDLFQRVSSSHQVAKVLEFQLQLQLSVLPMNIQDRFPLGWTVWISFQPKGLSRVFSNTKGQKYHFLYGPTFTSDMTTGKIIVEASTKMWHFKWVLALGVQVQALVT